jgi:hypothetical protein
MPSAKLRATIDGSIEHMVRVATHDGQSVPRHLFPFKK